MKEREASSLQKRAAVISSRQCLHTRYYTGKNRIFNLILARKPRSDATDTAVPYLILKCSEISCGFLTQL